MPYLVMTHMSKDWFKNHPHARKAPVVQSVFDNIEEAMEQADILRFKDRINFKSVEVRKCYE